MSDQNGSVEPARLVLASASPRRKELLTQIGLPPDQVIPSDIDESVRPGETPRTHAERLGREKLIACPVNDSFVLAGDTVVGVGRRILPKTESRAQAERCLRLMSGRNHRVFTSIFARAPDGRVSGRVVETRVGFKPLSETEIAIYLDSGEWRGKAGGYGIQGRAGAFVTGLVGSYTGVVGLPVYEARQLLLGLGYRS